MTAQQQDSLQITPVDAMAQFYESIFEKVVRRVLAEHNATFPSIDSELATQVARINAKPNITVSEAALLLNCSESHLYTKIAAARKKATKFPIPFLDLDGVYVFPRVKLIEWAEEEKERKPRKPLKSKKGGA
jgi:hypothetical protein